MPATRVEEGALLQRLCYQVSYGKDDKGFAGLGHNFSTGWTGFEGWVEAEVDGKDRRMEGRKPVSGTLNAERSTLNAEVGIRQ
jgi:hypothetical protein